MPFVDEIEQAEATPQLREIYTQIEKGFGVLPHFFKALGPMPEVIDAQLRLTEAIMRDGALPAALKEQLAVVVSGINSSSYCIAIHMELLQKFGIDKPAARKFATDYLNAPVDDKTKVLFRFAEKLTRKPLDIDQPDVDEVLRAGWSQAALRETVLAVSFFNYINRVSFGLGLVADF
jgi:uncharacterized peroxidase-related enzyme